VKEGATKCNKRLPALYTHAEAHPPGRPRRALALALATSASTDSRDRQLGRRSTVARELDLILLATPFDCMGGARQSRLRVPIKQLHLIIPCWPRTSTEAHVRVQRKFHQPTAFPLLTVHFTTASVVQWSELPVTDPEVQIRFPALPHFVRSSGSGTGSTQPREELLGRKESSGSGLESREYSHRDSSR
jgi:hypothetical protein